MLNKQDKTAIQSYLEANYPEQMKAFKNAYKFLLSDLNNGPNGLGDMPTDYSFTAYCSKADNAINDLPSTIYYMPDSGCVLESEPTGEYFPDEHGMDEGHFVESEDYYEFSIKEILINPDLRGHI